MTQPEQRKAADSGLGLIIGRVAAALVLLAWAALAATQALAGWNLLVSVLTGMWLLMAVSLFLYASKPARRESFWEKPLLVVFSIACVLLPLLLTVILRMWPAPIAAAVWAVVMGLVFANLMFEVRWLARVVGAICSGTAAVMAMIATFSMVMTSLENDGNPLSGLDKLPTTATHVAAVVLAAVAPFSLAATVYVLRKEWTAEDRTTEWERDIQMILESRRVVLDYLRDRRQGGPPDRDFEQRRLSSMRLTTLDLAEIVSAFSDEQNLPEGDVYRFLSKDGLTIDKLALLFIRVRALSREFGQMERFKLLSTGVVGDRSEIGPLPREFDNVGLVMRYCDEIEKWCVEPRNGGRMACML